MNELDDPLDLLRSLAPLPGEADAYNEVLARVLREATPRRRHAHRRLRIAAAAFAVAIMGAGTIAAAAGVTPSEAWQYVSGSSSKDLIQGPFAPHGKKYQPDPSTSRKVFSVPGPNGREFAGWTVENYVGWQCVSAYFEPQGATHFSLARFRASGGGCVESRKHDERSLFGDGTGGNSDTAFNNHVTFVYTSGDAARVELVVSNGHRFPLPIQDGWFGGWFSRAKVPLGASANIVAYDAQGHVLRSFDILDQIGCPKDQLC
jgi:hypothetical protein